MKINHACLALLFSPFSMPKRCALWLTSFTTSTGVSTCAPLFRNFYTKLLHRRRQMAHYTQAYLVGAANVFWGHTHTHILCPEVHGCPTGAQPCHTVLASNCWLALHRTQLTTALTCCYACVCTPRSRRHCGPCPAAGDAERAALTHANL